MATDATAARRALEELLDEIASVCAGYPYTEPGPTIAAIVRVTRSRLAAVQPAEHVPSSWMCLYCGNKHLNYVGPCVKCKTPYGQSVPPAPAPVPDPVEQFLGMTRAEFERRVSDNAERMRVLERELAALREGAEPAPTGAHERGSAVHAPDCGLNVEVVDGLEARVCTCDAAVPPAEPAPKGGDAHATPDRPVRARRPDMSTGAHERASAVRGEVGSVPDAPASSQPVPAPAPEQADDELNGDDARAWMAAAVEWEQKLTEAEARVQALEQERDEYRTLAKIGTWHDDCRPNRQMAARELEKSQTVINKLADEITVLRAEVARLRAALEGAFTVLEALRISVEWELAPSIKAEVAKQADAARAALAEGQP